MQTFSSYVSVGNNSDQTVSQITIKVRQPEQTLAGPEPLRLAGLLHIVVRTEATLIAG